MQLSPLSLIPLGASMLLLFVAAAALAWTFFTFASRDLLSRRTAANATGATGAANGDPKVTPCADADKDARAGRDADALTKVDALLQTPLPPLVEANARVIRVIALFGIGWIAEAHQEAARADALIAGLDESSDQQRLIYWLRMAQGRYADAARAGQRVAELLPSDQRRERAACLRFLATAYDMQGDTVRAESVMAQAIALDPVSGLSNVHRVVHAQYLHHVDRGVEADRELALVVDVARQQKKGSLLQLALAMQAHRKLAQGDIAAARDLQRQASEAAEAHANVMLLEVVLDEEMERWEAARQTLNVALQYPIKGYSHARRRHYAIVSINMALVLTELGDVEQLDAHLAGAAGLLSSEDHYQSVVEAFRAAADALRGDARAAVHRIDALLRENELRSLPPMQSRRVYRPLGRACMRIPDPVRGRICWERCIALNPHRNKVPQDNWYLGQCCEMLGDTKAALTAYRTAVAANVPIPATHRARARLLELTGDIGGAPE